MDHYRCLKTYIPKTHRERISDTLDLIPNIIPIPESNLEDHIKNMSEQLIHLLANKKKATGPFLEETTKSGLLEIARLLGRSTSVSLATWAKSGEQLGTSSTRLSLVLMSLRDGERALMRQTVLWSGPLENCTLTRTFLQMRRQSVKK